MPMTLDEAKLFYNSAQILTDDKEVLVCTLSDPETIVYTLVSIDAYNNRRAYPRNIDPLVLKTLLAAWLQDNFNIDFERFHGCVQQ